MQALIERALSGERRAHAVVLSAIVESGGDRALLLRRLRGARKLFYELGDVSGQMLLDVVIAALETIRSAKR